MGRDEAPSGTSSGGRDEAPSGTSSSLTPREGPSEGLVAPGIVSPPTGRLRGEALSEGEFRSATGAVEHDLDARYSWDAGVAIGRFLDGLEEGLILGRECRGCRRILVPPRMFCERCFRGTDAWVEVQQTGVVQTFSICHVRWDMQPLDEPEIPAVITIDGSDGGLLHMLGDVAPDDVSVGMAVEAVWRPESERTGSILDIAYFRPRGEA
ncbi:MAG: Zn-ribbon domain-containing OB-fold protein [Actinomycetota bacterium]